MSLKRIFVALSLSLVLCWAGGLWAGGPQLKINEPVHDFGEAVEGEVVSHEFLLSNTGTEELQIQDVRPG